MTPRQVHVIGFSLRLWAEVTVSSTHRRIASRKAAPAPATWTELSDPVGLDLRAEAEKEKAEESYGGLVLALWDLALTLFLAP